MVASTPNGACACAPSHLPRHPGGMRRRGMPARMQQGGDGVGRLTVHGHAPWSHQPLLAAQSSPPEGRPQIEHPANCLSRQAVDGNLRSVAAPNRRSQSSLRKSTQGQSPSNWKSMGYCRCTWREPAIAMRTQQPTNQRKAFSYRDDPSVPDFPDDRPIIVFDGHCVVCSGFARFVVRHDRRAVFRLMAAQTPLGQAIYRHLNLDPVNFETNVLLENGRAWFKSEGTIRMFVQLGFPWSMSRVLRLVPRTLLDRLYDWVARNRLRWFGSQSTCFMAAPAHRDRFLE